MLTSPVWWPGRSRRSALRRRWRAPGTSIERRWSAPWPCSPTPCQQSTASRAAGRLGLLCDVGLHSAPDGVPRQFHQAARLIEFDLTTWPAYSFSMNAVEFTTELSGAAVLPIPQEIAAQLPKSGKARVIVLTDDATDEAEWRAGAYEQFMRDDSAEDAVYDSLR